MRNLIEWDTVYSADSGRHKNRYPSDLVVGWVLRNFKGKTFKCLDVGCGYGNNLRFLLAEGFDAYGIDFSSAVIKQITGEFCDRVLIASAEDIPYEDETFDFIIDRSSLQHNPTKRLPVIFKECHRVLRGGGGGFSVSC